MGIWRCWRQAGGAGGKLEVQEASSGYLEVQGASSAIVQSVTRVLAPLFLVKRLACSHKKFEANGLLRTCERDFTMRANYHIECAGYKFLTIQDALQIKTSKYKPNHTKTPKKKNTG